MARQSLMTTKEREKALDADYQTWLQGEIYKPRNTPATTSSTLTVTPSNSTD